MNQINNLRGPGLLPGKIKTVGVWGGDAFRLMLLKWQASRDVPFTVSALTLTRQQQWSQSHIWALKGPHTRGLCGWKRSRVIVLVILGLV